MLSNVLIYNQRCHVPAVEAMMEFTRFGGQVPARTRWFGKVCPSRTATHVLYPLECKVETVRLFCEGERSCTRSPTSWGQFELAASVG